jgi:hypothetical protein
MKTKYIIYTFVFTSLMLSCGSTKTTVNPDDKLIGDWSLITKDTPQGDVSLKMKLVNSQVHLRR